MEHDDEEARREAAVGRLLREARADESQRAVAQQASGRAVPLRTDSGRGISMQFDHGAFVYISAQNTGERGTVTCRIVGSDGTVISENTSSGAYAVAACDGSAR